MPQSPPVRLFKNLRNRITDSFYRGRPAAGLDELVQQLVVAHDDNLCFAIAFNTPWVIDFLTRLWAKNVQDARLVIVDNSSSRAKAAQIAKLCRERGVPYLKLPWNPEWNPNRSHGIAANWVFYNIVRRVQPRHFGFIDHDCFPIAPFSVEAQLRGYQVYGFVHQVVGQPQWNLWAGFTFMNTSVVLDRAVDFKPWHDFGMDTGGANWPGVYAQIPLAQRHAADYQRVVYHYRGGELHCELLDNAFLHVGGASYALRTTKAEYVARMQSFLSENLLAT